MYLGNHNTEVRFFFFNQHVTKKNACVLEQIHGASIPLMGEEDLRYECFEL